MKRATSTTYHINPSEILEVLKTLLYRNNPGIWPDYRMREWKNKNFLALHTIRKNIIQIILAVRVKNFYFFIPLNGTTRHLVCAKILEK